MNNKQSGFTLLELLIVVAVIAVIAAIAIPNLRSSLIGSREAAAIGSMRTISTAVDQYRIRLGEYPEDLEELAVENPSLIDSELASGERNGYLYQLQSFQGGYSCNADPESTPDSRYFYVDETGVIRQSEGESAGPGSSPIQ
ncbi:MAG: prepilin-type N-terminal cleavage/methylation domain-containing protein [Planctomycetota bacterium]|nr:prepilin-type N-terminal cleavage/methylation domain-containing protein [Planctomycetota bacterium]